MTEQQRPSDGSDGAYEGHEGYGTGERHQTFGPPGPRSERHQTLVPESERHQTYEAHDADDRFFARAVARVTAQAFAPYQTAVVRIGFALTWLLFLLREFPHRHELYGPEGPWSFDLAERLIADNHAFTVLLWSDSAVWFELVYALAVAASVAVVVGWRTRTATVLFMIGVLGLQNRSVFMGDGGDNVLHIMAMYLVFTRCAEVWSLDARRRRREGRAPQEPAERDVTGVVLWSVLGAIMLAATVGGALSMGWGLFFWTLWAAQAVWRLVGNRAPYGEARAVCDMLAKLAHNAALLIIAVEVCFIYATAGWYKIQGSRWQDGTAVYYPMNLDYFSPWPEFTGFLAGSGLLVLLMTYITVAVQVAFPFTLFNRNIKNVLLGVMIMEHLSIAVLLGLPFFSMAMIAADAVFLPTVALVWLGARFDGGRRRFLARVRPQRAYDEGTGGTGAAGPGSAQVPQQRGGGVSVR